MRITSRDGSLIVERRNGSAPQPELPPRPSAPQPSARRSPTAQKIVAIWNARAKPAVASCGSTRRVGAAIAAGVPWLTYSCPACQQVGCIDLRTLDRHPGASISSIIPSVSCRRCSPNSPFARLEMLAAERPRRVSTSDRIP